MTRKARLAVIAGVIFAAMATPSMRGENVSGCFGHAVTSPGTMEDDSF